MLGVKTFFCFFSCWGLVACVADIDDFDDVFRGFEFIFHDNNDVGVAIHGDNCYFLEIKDNSEAAMDSQSHVKQLQLELIDLIRQNDPSQVRPSTLDAVRDKYQDRLADFHCIDKNIFEIFHGPICESGWYGFGDSCYKFVEQHVNHDRAREVCHDMDSQLVEITSGHENNFVRDMMTFHYAGIWIGLDDRQHEGRFVLPSTGREPGYAHWQPGQPDNFWPGQNCVKMQAISGLWVDTWCPEPHPFICEK